MGSQGVVGCGGYWQGVAGGIQHFCCSYRRWKPLLSTSSSANSISLASTRILKEVPVGGRVLSLPGVGRSRRRRVEEEEEKNILSSHPLFALNLSTLLYYPSSFLSLFLSPFHCQQKASTVLQDGLGVKDEEKMENTKSLKDL